MAPTVSVNADAAGYIHEAGHDSLPAAVTKGIPLSITFATASSNTAADAPRCSPLKDMLTTAGSCTFPGMSSQLSAATAAEVLYFPSGLVIASDTMLAPGAGPVVAPAAHPATCVP